MANLQMSGVDVVGYRRCSSGKMLRWLSAFKPYFRPKVTPPPLKSKARFKPPLKLAYPYLGSFKLKPI